MSVQLSFVYDPGEMLVYDTSVSTVYRNLDGTTLNKQMQSQLTTLIFAVEEGPRFRCRNQTRLIQLDGAQAKSPASPWVTFVQDHRGRILENQDPVHPIQAEIVFPSAPVEVGDCWEVDESADPASPDAASVAMELALEELVDRNGEQVAILSCGGQVQLDEGSATTLIDGEIHFSVTRGRKLWSKVLVSMQWESGRKVDSIEESRLVE